MRAFLARSALGFLVCAAEAATVPEALRDSVVWVADAPTGQQTFAAFRKVWELSEVPREAALHLFADSRYVLWINGRYVERGPCRFDPQAPGYDSLDARPYLCVGSNVLAVLVHHFHDGRPAVEGRALSGRMMRHEPGLAALLELKWASGREGSLRTDLSWRVSTHTRFLPVPTGDKDDSWSSIPDRVDARRESGDWTRVEFDDAAWSPASGVPGTSWGAFRPRPLPLLREGEVGPLLWLRPRRAEDGRTGIDPVTLTNALPLDLTVGETLTIDAGQFTQAYSEVELEASEGAELELEYAQGFHDTGDTLSGSYGRHNRYIAHAGRQTYLSLDTFGFKYLALRLRSGRMTVHGLRVVNRLYPFDRLGSFDSGDPVLDRLWRQCVSTIEICSEDAYVDCATRERVEWLADGYVVASRVSQVALTGPGSSGRPCYDDTRLLANLLRHIGQSLQPDGRLKAHHPSDRWDIHGYIEDYGCLWVQALREHYDRTGDLDLAREQWPALAAQLRWFLDRRTTNGLVKGREFVYFGNPLVYQVCEGATLNAYLAAALRDAASLASRLDKPAEQRAYAEAAAALGQAINDRLWDAGAGAYAGALREGTLTPPTVHAAVMALAFDVVPETRREAVRRWLWNNYSKEDFSPYAHHFLLRELYRLDTPEADQAALDLMRRRWAPMLRGESGTVWEGFGPGENCHEAGAVPAYFLSAYVLGVRMEGPAGQRQLRIEPRLANLPWARGVVGTERGPVTVSWERPNAKSELQFQVTVPEGGAASVRLPRLGERTALVVDGAPLSASAAPQPSGAAPPSRWLTFTLGPGRHEGRLRLAP